MAAAQVASVSAWPAPEPGQPERSPRGVTLDLRSTDATTLQRVERERAAFIARLAEALQTCGAGHDAQGMARICHSARIFMPTVKGIRHDPREQTAPPASRTARTYCSRCW